MTDPQRCLTVLTVVLGFILPSRPSNAQQPPDPGPPQDPGPPIVALVDPCDIGLCDCLQSQLLDLVPYFVPNYPGWDTAKKLWIDSSGGGTHLRFFSYTIDRYELMKFGNNYSSETFQVTWDRIYITAENNINNTSQSRTWRDLGLDWLPRYACKNKPNLNQFDICHSGEDYYQNCQFTQAFLPHCGLYQGRIVILFGYNYGYNVGVVDTIVRVHKLDNAATEKYYYGLNKGFLRFEYLEPSGAMSFWAAQTGEQPNSPLVHQGCFQP